MKTIKGLIYFLIGWGLYLLSFPGDAISLEQKKAWIPDYNKRDKWQQPEKILDTIGIIPGMIVADVGCGTGYLTLRIAKRVGETGMVYATDIREDRIRALGKKAQKAGFKNIVTIVGTEKDPGLPKNTFDVIILLHVIHIVINKQNPQALLTKIKLALKDDGLLVIIHWDGPKMGYPEKEAYSKESVLDLIRKSGFRLERLKTFLPRDNIFILKKNTLKRKNHEKTDFCCWAANCS